MHIVLSLGLTNSKEQKRKYAYNGPNGTARLTPKFFPRHRHHNNHVDEYTDADKNWYRLSSCHNRVELWYDVEDVVKYQEARAYAAEMVKANKP